jgi:hypothetical protein
MSSQANAEVVVCGAGAAGSAAALAAARAGARVHLLEAAPRPGGTVAHSLIHTVGGLYDSDGKPLQGGLVTELVRRLTQEDPATGPRRLGRTWVLNVCPAVYRSVLERWLAAEPCLMLRCQARVARLEVRGGRISEIRVVCPGQELRLRPQAVIDATGTAEVVRLLDASLLQGPGRAAAGGLILRLRGVAAGALAFPRGVAVVHALRAAAREGTLPGACANSWLDRGVYEDEAYLKLSVPLPADWRLQQELIVATARRGGEAILAFLRRFPEFAQARIEQVGALGVRDGGRIRGEYCLTRQDVLAGRKFADAACRCAWPIEFWDPLTGVSLEYLPASTWYEVPLRALKVQGLDNLWAVGKCLSADADAQASARIAGCCWGMGQAVGKVVADGAIAWR